MKLVVKKLSKAFKVKRTSSVYEAEALSVAVQISTNLAAKDLLRELQKVEEAANTTTRCVDIDLLFYERDAYIDPFLTLPHPEAHRRPQILIPAAEIDGQYVHPVLEKTLSELSARFSKVDWGKFYSGGQTLLDF